MVDLYDDQPNVTSGSGFGAPTSFSNFSLTYDAAIVPEPATWILFLVAFLGLGLRTFHSRHRFQEEAAS